MRLSKATIENFRSIKNLEVNINNVAGKSCNIFFGINESGKSNILKAIALVKKSTPFNYDRDCEKSAYKQSKKVVLRYLFDVVQENKINDKIKEIGLPHELLRQIRIKQVEKSITFDKESQRIEHYIFYFDEGILYGAFTYDVKGNKIVTKTSTILHYPNSQFQLILQRFWCCISYQT